MGMLDRLTRWWRGRKFDAMVSGKKSTTFEVVATLDGWVPAMQFVDSDLDRLYTAASWSYACISANAEALASMPPILQRFQDGRWQRAQDSHPLWNVLRQPFGMTPGWPRWAWSQLLKTITLQWQISGNAFLRPAYLEGRQRLGALYLIRNPGQVAAIEDPSTKLIRGYRYGNEQLRQADLVNISSAAPTSLWKGQSPLAVALNAIETDATAAARQNANLKNKIQPGLVIMINDPHGLGIDNEKRDELLAWLKEKYQAATMSGQPLVVGGDTKIQEPPNARELEYFRTRKFSRDEMVSVLKTPPPVIGIYENATLQNFREAFKIWWMSLLFPLTHAIYDAINVQAVWPIYGAKFRFWYDLSQTEIGLVLMRDRLEIAEKIKGLGYSANIAAAEAGLDLPFVPELEVYNAQLLEAGRVVPELPAGTDSDPIATDAEVTVPPEPASADAQ